MVTETEINIDSINENPKGFIKVDKEFITDEQMNAIINASIGLLENKQIRKFTLSKSDDSQINVDIMIWPIKAIDHILFKAIITKDGIQFENK